MFIHCMNAEFVEEKSSERSTSIPSRLTPPSKFQSNVKFSPSSSVKTSGIGNGVYVYVVKISEKI